MDAIESAFKQKQLLRVKSQDRVLQTRMTVFSQEKDQKACLQNQDIAFIETFKGDTLRAKYDLQEKKRSSNRHALFVNQSQPSFSDFKRRA